MGINFDDLVEMLKGPCLLCGGLPTPENKVSVLASGNGVVHAACVEIVENAVGCEFCGLPFGEKRVFILSVFGKRMVVHSDCL